MVHLVTATPCMGVNKLNQHASSLEHESDEAIGQACGVALSEAKKAGVDIHSEHFAIIVTFV